MKPIGKWLIAVAVIAILITVTWKFWEREYILVSVHYLLRNDPGADIVPVNRTLSPTKGFSGQTYQFDAITFEAPWLVTPLRRGNGVDALALNFIAGSQSSSVSPLIFATQIDASTSASIAEARMILATYPDPPFQSLKTNYDYYDLMFSLTRADIGYFKPAAHSIGSAILLVEKSVLLTNLQTYRIHNDYGVRGFELPLSATSTEYKLFTKSDQEFDFLIANASQDEQDVIIGSVR